MPTDAAARVAAVIPTWNRRDLLATVLRNLTEQTSPFAEIIVIDNGSEDDSAVPQRRERESWKWANWPAAVNRGIEAADAEWVAILNNDVTLEPDWLTKLLAAAAQEDTRFATGKILQAG